MGLKLIGFLLIPIAIVGCVSLKAEHPKPKYVPLSIEQFPNESGLCFQLCLACEVATQKTLVTTQIDRPLNLPTAAKTIGSMRITLNFANDSHALSDREQQRLSAFLRDVDWELASSLQIIGYTDNRGSGDYNQALSRRRANSVNQYLSKNALKLPDEVNITGFGKCCYISTNTTTQGRARNRRVTLMIQTLQTISESE